MSHTNHLPKQKCHFQSDHPAMLWHSELHFQSLSSSTAVKTRETRYRLSYCNKTIICYNSMELFIGFHEEWQTVIKKGSRIQELTLFSGSLMSGNATAETFFCSLCNSLRQRSICSESGIYSFIQLMSGILSFQDSKVCKVASSNQNQIQKHDKITFVLIIFFTIIISQGAEQENISEAYLV